MFGKKKAKLFGNEVEANCAYCAHASGKDCVLGSKDRPCGHFRYDPLKRTPSVSPVLKHYDPDEFKL